MDCFVLTTRALRTGDIVECDGIGLMEQIEDGEIDHKVLAVILGEDKPLNDHIKQVLADFCCHVFDHVPGKTMQIGQFRDAKAAMDYVAHHDDAVKCCFSKIENP